MKRFIAMMLCLALCLPLIPASAEEEKTLNLFTWEGYVDPNTIANFTAETGVKVNFTTFSTNEEMLLKLQATGGGDYDLVIASDYVVNIARKQNLMLPLDKAQIPNYANIDPEFQSQYYDPENLYTVPYTAGTPLIVYDPSVVTCEITGYNSLWDESLRDSIVLIDDARVVIGVTLISMGYPMNVTDEKILNEAAEKLKTLRPNIRTFNYDTPYVDLLSGECSVAFMFTPLIVWALEENPELKVVYPEEGMGFGIDSLFIPVNAPHPAAAHQMINYLLDPQVAVNVAVEQDYICPVGAAREYLPQELLNNPALYIPKEILGTPQFVEDVGEEFESLYQRIWTDFKMQ